jgi:hypothetical protein
VTLSSLTCAPNPLGIPDYFQLLVFPAQGELGGSAAVVLSSNYIPGSDAHERYDLERSRITVKLRDASGALRDADVRAVFPIAASAISHFAKTHPGAWVTIVLFDLPDSQSGFALPESGASFRSEVIVEVDEQAVDVQEVVDVGPPTGFISASSAASIRITGSNGTPLSVSYPNILDLEQLPLMLRVRAARDHQGNGNGFPLDPQGTTIGGIEGDLVYLKACLLNPVAATNSEAADAGVYLGPQKTVPGSSTLFYRRFVLTAPQGFTLLPPSGGAPDALGEGPLLDVTFVDAIPPNPSCETVDAWLSNVYVVTTSDRGRSRCGAASRERNPGSTRASG